MEGMNEDLKRSMERIAREYGERGPEPKRWPRDRAGVLLRVPTPELDPIWLRALQDLAALCKTKPMILCQGCGESLTAWDCDIDGPHLCHVCKETGGKR